MRWNRPGRVGNLVRQVVSDAIANRLGDPRIEQFTSVTRVEVTPDMEIAKIYVSVLGDDSAGRRTLAGLCSAAGLIRRMVASAVQMRTCPQIDFRLDESIKRSAETVRLIDKTLAESHQQEPTGIEDEADAVDSRLGDDDE